MISDTYYRVRACGLLTALAVAPAEALAEVTGLSVADVCTAAEAFKETAERESLDSSPRPAAGGIGTEARRQAHGTPGTAVVQVGEVGQ